jgi:nuclear transport factor 2 (NTF2) superfamily protein
MAELVMTVEDFEKFKAPLLEEVSRIREENAYYRILLKEHQWLSREETETLLGISADTLLRNREKWNIRYRKGKHFVSYWLPDIWKYLKEVNHLKTEEIEKRIQLALHSDESLAA